MPYPPWGMRETDAYAYTVRRRATRGYGWSPDQPDHRDEAYAPATIEGPPAVNLQPECPPVYDQGPLAACTSHAVAAAIQFIRMKNRSSLAELVPSRLFIYFGQRVISGTVDGDSGGSLRDAIKVVASDGVCLEEDPAAAWPYFVSRFADRPPRPCFDQALKGEVKSYHRLTQDIAHLEACLAEGFPFICGFSTFAGLESDALKAGGALRMPEPEEQPIGGHAAMVVGYNRRTRYFNVRNCWGADWGSSGYFLMPYDYLADPHLAADFWTIRLVDVP